MRVTTLPTPVLISIYIPEENLFQVIVDLFFAGTDTTAETLRWILLHLLHNRDAQNKCREEIFKVWKTVLITSY